MRIGVGKKMVLPNFVLELEGNGGGRGAVDTGGLSEGTEGGVGNTGRHYVEGMG